jgi:hypothetical protein
LRRWKSPDSLSGVQTPQAQEIPIAPSGRSRLPYLALAAATIAIGLGLQWVRPDLPRAFADILGDALWGLMMFWLVGAIGPAIRALTRGVIALAVCWVVEFSQLYHTPWLDAWRGTVLGHLTLGSGFDLRDLVAYGLGVLVGIRLEATILLGATGRMGRGTQGQ